MSARRPDPEALLAGLREEERRAGRGRLKVFFGASPGVGKTYAMLEAARIRRREGTDVVLGVVETHGRAETDALLAGFEILPRLRLEYRGIILEEFDLDAALARRPGLLLVDELAHTNAAGSRHAKRWQDVEELLAAGIDVYSTLNIQHLQSLNDVVAQITGVTVRETVPDAVLEGADEVELVDLPPDELLQRLREGRVYVPEQASRALEQFFRKGNLIALRELVLRRTAERVDAQMRRYMRASGIRETWPVVDRLLVSVGANPHSARLIRAGKRMATALKCDWLAVYVETPGHAHLPASDREALATNLHLAEELGSQVATLTGQNAAEELLSYAREHNVTKIIVGKPTHPRWRDKLFGSMLDQLVRGSGDLDVYVITGEAEGEPPRREAPAGEAAPFRQYVEAVAIVALSTLVSWPVSRLLGVTDVAMIFLLGSAIAASRLGRWPSILAAVLSVACFDFFFVEPFLTFAVSDLRFLITFGVMLSVTLLISTLTLRIRRQASSARERERRTAALYFLSRDLTAPITRAELVAVAEPRWRVTFGAAVVTLVRDGDGGLDVLPTAPGDFPLDEKERAVADWVLRHGRPAGKGTDTLPGARARYVPLIGSSETLGVVALADTVQDLDEPAQRRQLEAFAGQTALALERVILAEQTHKAQVEIEAERLRTALLSSLSHDLRTPLGVITGAATALQEDSTSPRARSELLQSIIEESLRMGRLVDNLLDMIRLESGSLQVQKDWQNLEESIGAALIRLGDRLAAHPTTVTLPPDLPPVPLDPVLIEQVFVNLLENAARYTPPGTPVEISAEARRDDVVVTVADRGPGLEPGEERKVFEKFYRGRGKDTPGGVGLGLAICEGIITAHGGRIWAEARPGGGAAFRFTLPLSGPPRALPPPEAEPGT